jgi:formylglycine-generating enzyme required for sulfatase activity
VKCEIAFPLPLPDDPKKWDGWSKYKSSNLYERLCLDPYTNPSNELIEEHCRELLRWWQKKLPLKNQPSNPLAQLLRSGLDESSRYLTEARMELLDPTRRHALDGELAAQAHEEAVAEFRKYLTFAIANGSLTADEEKNLLQLGAEHGLKKEDLLSIIEAELKDSGAKRVEPEPPPATTGPRPLRSQSLNPRQDFMRMLRLSGLDSDQMTDDQRDAFINMAENLGLESADAEDLVDVYLEEADKISNPEVVVAPKPVVRIEPKEPAASARNGDAVPEAVAETPQIKIDIAGERAQFINFQNAVGGQMLLVPSGEFVMGSDAADAAPNERPLTRVALTRFYLSRHLITNAQYEQFDSTHSRKRATGTGDNHPVVYVSSLEAIKFCQWLGGREHKKYRLPTEAEWEYAARGTDGRRYPWGNYQRRGDLANFADKNTVFAWSDREVDDGYAESSPVGAFPLGVSPFGMEDMAGNVWEWCLDYLEAYRGTPRVNPRGSTAGSKRVYRGGSWKSRFNSLRATARGSNVPNYSCNDLGFRVLCECD